jgi:hypothetical protein
MRKKDVNLITSLAPVSTVAMADSRRPRKSDKVEKHHAERYKEKYFADPVAFMCDCLDVDRKNVWPKMQEMADSVQKYQKTCVYAGHGVSKSYTAARLALWFLLTHKPSTVITTAPSYDQVEKVLWKEIHTAISNAKWEWPGNMTTMQYDIDPRRKWFAYGFATKPDTVTGEATRAQGSHNKYVLIIIDEAAGVMPQIWKAFESLLLDPDCKVLAIGNPTSSQGAFADCENDPTWNCINISVKDTPNFKTGKMVIKGLSGREFEEMERVKYGIESNEYAIRVLGRKPEYSGGTYLGKWLAEAADRIGDIVWEPAVKVHTVWDIGDVYTAIWFVQFVKEQIHLIDFYYDCVGQGLPAYAKVLEDKKYIYGKHYAPPDIAGSNARSFQTGTYTMDVARLLGLNFEIIDRCSVEDRIEAARGIMPKCWFSKKAAEGVEGLKDWRKRRNEGLSTPDKPVYFEDAVKSWGRHVGDAFSYLAVVYRYSEFDGEILGSMESNFPVAVQRQKRYDYNPLSLARL